VERRRVSNDDMIEEVRRVTTHYEREFRLRVFQAQSNDEKLQAEFGLRHAKGFRASVEKLRAPAVAST